MNTKAKGPVFPAPVKCYNNIIAQKKVIMKSKKEVEDIELAGCLVKRSINIFVAPSGSGKSLIAFCLAWKETKENNFKTTFYLDLDNPIDLYKDRYINFEELDNLIYISTWDIMNIFTEYTGTNPKEKALNILKDLSNDSEVNNTLIVIDCLQAFCDYNDLKELRNFFEICRKLTQLGATILIIHHKSSKTEAPSFKGLSYIKDSADTMWDVVPNKSRSGIVMSAKLVNTKARSTTGYTNFIVSFDTDQGTVSYDQNVLFEDELPIKDAIIKFLTTNPNSNQGNIIQAIKPLTNIGEKRIRVVLEKLVGLHELTVTKGHKNAKVYNIASKYTAT